MTGQRTNGARPQPRLRLGGMALRNGLLIHGPTSWSAAARGADGNVHVASGRKPSLSAGALGRIPLLRGPLRLAEAFAVIPVARRNLPQARLPFEEPRVLAAAIATTMASGAIRRDAPAGIGREGLATALGLLPAMVALSGSDLPAYHAVEHKAIGAYEQGSPDPAAVPKEHERCGSNLIAPLLGLSVGGQLLVDRLLERPGRLARGAAGLASVSLAVEMFAYAERHPESGFAHALRRPGTEIQRLVATREPTPEQLEVGVAALDEILRVEGAEG